MPQNKWFIIPHPRPAATMRIFCFPYAGGSARTYMNWYKSLPEHIEIVAVQPPGRGARLMEDLFSDMDSLIAELIQLIPKYLDKPYILFGHSLGSRVAFELLTNIVKLQLPLPIHFIASGSKGPQLQTRNEITHTLSDSAFIQKLTKLNGTPKEVLENKELMDIFLPLLRADFKLSETYRYTGDIQIDCPLSIFTGDQDIDINDNDLNGWSQFFNKNSTIYPIPGDHFFIDRNATLVIKKINEICQVAAR